MEDKVNVILIQIDSLNRHFLPIYGNDWVHTPNLDAFAARSAVFDQHFIGSAPCMPARREIWTGTQEFWWRGWGPLEPWDKPIAYLARQSGTPLTTHLVTDHYHFFEWGSHSYTYDYHGYNFIRGHEFDNWHSDPLKEIPDWAGVMRQRRGSSAEIYIRNVQDFTVEGDFFGPQVMRSAAHWLERNHEQDQFFLHIDSFDVHEPFHIPEPYRSMYTDGDYRKYSPWPLYGSTEAGPAALQAEELAWVRAQYAGKLSMLDHWLGTLFDQLDRHNLWDRTCVILTTDHGHYLGEHGWIGKPAAPLYHTLSHIPLLVWHPRSPRLGQRLAAITQTVDLYATVLDILGLIVPVAANIHSRSFLPLLLGQGTTHRHEAIYGYHNKRVGITAGDWTLLRYHQPEAAPAALYTHDIRHTDSFGFYPRGQRRFNWPEIEAGYFIPGVDMPIWRVRMPEDWAQSQPQERGDLLFHNLADPGQQEDCAASHPEVIARLEENLREYMRTIQAPEEQWRRLRL